MGRYWISAARIECRLKIKKNWAHTAFGHVHTLPDIFCTATKIMLGRASVHTKERLWWHDFCDGTKLRDADL